MTPELLTKAAIARMDPTEVRRHLGDTDFSEQTNRAHGRVLLHVAQRAIFSELLLKRTEGGTAETVVGNHQAADLPPHELDQDTQLIHQIPRETRPDVRPWLGHGFIRLR